MTFISYAQNLEDVMLWKALKNVENGFYIDVGANDPVIDSVTHSFYNQGWRGINIEPNCGHFRELVTDRPQDINLNCALNESVGELEIWECDIRGWDTLDKNIVKAHKAEGYKGQWRKVAVRTLADICVEFQPENIHFLKIDVEGSELSVLKGNDWDKYRPWVVVVESTFPNTQTETYLEIEELLIDKNYLFAYADGLNRFYVSIEHQELLPSFKYPPNIFDNYQTFSEFIALKNVEKEMQKFDDFSKVHEASLKRIRDLEHEISLCKNHIEQIYNSTSWRVSAPVRLLGWIINGKNGREQKACLFSRGGSKLIRIFNNNQRLRYYTVITAKKMGLYFVLHKLYLKVLVGSSTRTPFSVNEMLAGQSHAFFSFKSSNSLSLDELHSRIKDELKATKDERGQQ